MSLTLAALAGWALAAVALSLALIQSRATAGRREAVVRAVHELRGPLTAVGLAIELEARRGALRPDTRRAIEQELARAALALDDLRTGRESAATSSARLELVDAAELVSASVAAACGRADAAGVRLRSSWSGGPAYVEGDRLRLAQALSNLIVNAIEHGAGETPHGGGEIEHGGVETPHGGGETEDRGGETEHRAGQVAVRGRAEAGMVRLEVSDSGSGLSAPIATLARGARRGRGERGRGLAIASEIAERHGGRLASAPSPEGARLVLELPLALSRRDAVEAS